MNSSKKTHPVNKDKQETQKGERGVLAAKEQEETKVFVHGIHPFANIKDITDCFSPITEIFDVEFKRSAQTGKHKGYAFFSVKSKEIAKKLVQTSHRLKGRIIHCDYKYSNPEEHKKNQKKRIFIGGIPKIATDEEIIDFFSKFGKVRTGYSIKNLKGDNMGFGYVDFEEIKSAENLIKKRRVYFNGLNDRFGKYVDIREYKSRSQKKQNEEEEEKESIEKKNKAKSLKKIRDSFENPSLDDKLQVGVSFENRPYNYPLQLSFPHSNDSKFISPLMNRKGETVQRKIREMNYWIQINNVYMANYVQQEINLMIFNLHREGYVENLLNDLANRNF